jgi:hypothetical protein
MYAKTSFFCPHQHTDFPLYPSLTLPHRSDARLSPVSYPRCLIFPTLHGAEAQKKRLFDGPSLDQFMPQGGGCGAAPSAEPAVTPVKRCDVTGCVWRSVWSMDSIREDRPEPKHALIYGAVSGFQSGSRRRYPWARSSTRSRAVCATSGSIRLASDAEPLWIVYVLCMSVITVTVALFSLM